MPASPNDQTPRPTTGIRLSSPFLDALQAQRANPSKTSEKRMATPKLIPSPEGNTVTAPRRMTYSKAHPRSRGEHTLQLIIPALQRGSSPLARGTRRHSRPCVVTLGLIPARAGTTGSLSYPAGRSGAHPRSRGDHDISVLFTAPEKGSSPLARGPPSDEALRSAIDGLIPARAGTTQAWCWEFRRSWAHPRSRGDHSPR